jgi:deoxyadenosine kinase
MPLAVYLEDFYKDMKRYGFPLQIYLLNKRFRQQQQIVWEGRGGVQDRTIYEDAIFAKMLRDDGLMEEREYQTYLSLFNNMSNFMRKPNVIVYLDVTPEQSYERIKMRSRECESSLPLEYLIKLSRAYEDFLEDISQIIPVLRVDWSSFRSAEEMAEQIRVQYAAMRAIKRVDWDPVPATPPPTALSKPRYHPEEAEADDNGASEVARAMDAMAPPSKISCSPGGALSAESPN